ncbi:MAG: NusG domain II-containing protein [Roseburia sp.]
MDFWKKRLKKNDILFIVVVGVLLFLLVVFMQLTGGREGARVQVTVDGEVYGIYSLTQEQTVDIVIDGETTNTLVISEGEADMIWAECPDKLCVHQKAISKSNETIVCLPNKVVVQVLGGEESEFDSIAK